MRVDGWTRGLPGARRRYGCGRRLRLPRRGLLDLGLFADQTLGRIAINTVRPEARGRLNALYTGLFFIGGAAGAALAGLAWDWQGWAGVCWVGLGFTLAALIAGRCMRPRPSRGPVTARP